MIDTSEVLRRHNLGFTCLEISSDMDERYATVYQALKRRGVTPRCRRRGGVPKSMASIGCYGGPAIEHDPEEDAQRQHAEAASDRLLAALQKSSQPAGAPRYAHIPGRMLRLASNLFSPCGNSGALCAEASPR